jgi:CCR4-NOT transcription complex subunit 1
VNALLSVVFSVDQIQKLLIEAYEQDNLIAVVPLTCKILSCCTKSKIFKYPNPWISALLRLLLEIHNLPNLKQLLVFEIEGLFRILNIDIQCTLVI